MSQTPKSYHRATSYDRYAMEPHAMDWAHQPDPYKSYPGLDGISMSEGHKFFGQDLHGLYDIGRSFQKPDPLSLETLSTICLLAGGLTARSRQGDGYFYFRSAPSAGALYPNEMYFAAFDIKALPAGIYHCGVHNRFLTRLRDGKFANNILAAVPGLPEDSAGVFIISGIFFRSAWKYRKRAYRYILLDGGHLAENLRLAISAAGYDGGLYHAFDDKDLEILLGLDASKEASLCCVSISGRKTRSHSPEVKIAKLSEKIQAASRVSPSEIAYPEITDIHEASKTVIESDSEARFMLNGLGVFPPDGYVSIPDSAKNIGIMDYSETVLKRRSKRNFIPKPIQQSQLNYILTLLCRASDSMIGIHPDIASSACIGFVAGNVKGLDSGFYLLDPLARKTGRIFPGNFIEKMSVICLDQAWLKNAAVHFVFMSNFEILGEKWGARGYRYAMMTAGRLGHAVYLGATALGLGCCGIGALYDNEAKELLGLNHDSALVYLVAAGNTN